MRRQYPQGLTLVELIVAIGISGLVGVVLVAFVSSTFNLWRLTREQQDLQFKTRIALRSITTEIREMQDASNGSFAIATANPNEFIFYSNVDQDDDIERVRYFFESNALKRGLIEPSGSPALYPSGSETISIIVSDVYLSGDMFSYYDETYTGVEDPLSSPFDNTDVHLVKISFSIDNDPINPPGANEITTEITPRNLKQYAPES